jgi:hypothetical protein
VVLSAATATRVAHAGATAAHAPSFACPWSWALYDGLRPGSVTAGASANCAGRKGSLTLSLRLLSQKPGSTAWRTDVFRRKTWRRLRHDRFLNVAEPCVAEKVRAVFRWTLRDTRGTVVSRNVVRSGTLQVPGPGCKLTLG